MKNHLSTLAALSILSLSAPAIAGDGGAKLPAFVWSESPSIEQAPADGVSGSIDGVPFEFRHIEIKAIERSYRIDVRSGADAGAPGPRIALHEVPVVGAAQRRGMLEPPGGTYLEAMSPSGHGTQEIEGRFAWTVVFTKWDVKPFAADTRNGVAGRASGKLVLVWKAEGHPNGWIAGTFTDVPVRYGPSAPLCAVACEVPAAYRPQDHLAQAGNEPDKPVPLKWTETPVLGMAPARGVSAELAGRKIAIQEIFVSGGPESWALGLLSRSVAPSSGIVLRLFQHPVTGAVFRRALGQRLVSPTHAPYSLEIQKPGKPDETLEWRGDVAYVVQFTRWDMKPFGEADADGHAGTASGRVVVMLKGAEGSKNGWIAGTFTDVPVIHQESPPLCGRACVGPP